MSKIKKLFNSKWFLGTLLLISFLFNLLFAFTNFSSPYVPLSKKINFANRAPYDTTDTIYLAQGVIAFNDKEMQPKDGMQIVTFYMDKVTGKVYQDEILVLENVMVHSSRSELQIISFDKNTNLVTLSGNGWEKVVIDGSKKEAIQLTDTTGDVVTLKNTWEIQ